MKLNNWLTRLVARRALRWANEYKFAHEPNIYIGGRQNPYLIRWYVIPRNRFFNVYLHQFMRSDDDRALHDHPWWSVSLSLSVEMEEIFRDWLGREKRREVLPGSLVFRRARFAHRMVVPIPGALTIFVTGPKIREWGFLCPKGWRPWREFVDARDHGAIGRGCD